MTFPMVQYLSEDGVLSKECPISIPHEILLKGYKIMLQTRYVDERMITLQRQGLITFALSSLGEECCAVASAAALDLDDWTYPQYREAGLIFWRGFSIQDYTHHMFSNAKDLMLGRQMPNHFGSRKLNVVTVSSPIGTKIPHAAGCAYAMMLQGEKHVAVCYFGEGASSEGDFHAGLNFAAVRKAPAIFFCRNNGYAISTPLSKQFASDGIAPKGEGYGMKSVRVDGNDFFAVYQVIKEAKEHCLSGYGPVLVEAMTYRLGAHSTADDPSVYRKSEEVEKMELKDPILRLGKYLRKNALWDDDKEKHLHEAILKEIEEAITVAKETPKPPLHTLIENVYFDVPHNLQEQFSEIKSLFSGE